jgi:hypothetical protein
LGHRTNRNRLLTLLLPLQTICSIQHFLTFNEA